jgi:hypothetical protein
MMNRRLLVVLMLVAVAAMVGQPAWSQATISTGSIQGTVTDPQGAAVVNAEVTISSQNGGKSIEVVTNGSGLYNSGPLTPGIYAVRVSAQGFQTIALSITVQVGSISSGNIALTLGSQATVVEVTSGAVLVNTEQAQIQGVVTADQIDNLPINGRNFLDLAQLEPGVQIQDGGDFDPTKTGFSSISFGGRFGRTARIEVDGVDVSDENVGTTTESIPASAISEFQLAQSSLDLSNELTSSGAVNVVTKSGTNSFHGEGYGLFRTSTQGAELPGDGTYQRGQEGGDVGGPIIKDKLYFFADGERTLQHAGAGVAPAPPFDSFAGSFPSPFKEGDLLGRVDFQATKSLHIFYRFDYFSNYLVPPFGPPSFSFFANKDITRSDVVGGDWTTGPWTHSIRFEYLRFQNQITDAVRGSGEPFANFPVSTDFFVSNLATGPSDDAPQKTPQSDHEVKYDGSRIFGSHILRYGVAYNHLQGGGFASFFAFAPLALNFQINTTNPIQPGYSSFVPTAGLVCPGGQTEQACPLNYVADELLIGNGQGFDSEKPAFGQPFGGIGPDNRFAFYVGDSWKIKSNLTLTYGTRYVRDTGRTDSDLPAIPALNALLPGLGNPVHQPNANFGPQIGLAWDPFKTGKTVIRGGAGIYYENSVWNNVLFDRPPRLQTGTFFFTDAAPCFFGAAEPVLFGDGTTPTIPGGTALCGAALGATIPAAAVGATCPAGIIVAQCMVNFQSEYAASYAAHPLNPNPGYIGTEIADGLPISGVFNPNYLSPRSVQLNVGFQRELSKGTVLSVDYIRNIGTHFLLGIDDNQTGNAAYLDPAAGATAIATTLANCGVGTINQSIVNCPTDPRGPLDAIENGYTPRPATIADYAFNGLDGPKDLGVGVCNGPNGIVSGNKCAFAGINPNIGPTDFLTPVGRSLYNAMDVKLTQNVRNPAPGIKYLNLQVSYALSRFKYCGSSNGLASPGTPGNQDQDFIDSSLDNQNPCRYFGSTLLDRTHQLNFGGWANLPAGFRLGIVGHVWSPLAITPTLDLTAGPGSIFQTDFTGDGTVNDPLPLAQTSASCGTEGGFCSYTMARSGAFGRGLNPGSLGTAINNYNANIANTEVTPAGQAVINAGLMTLTQLQELGGVAQPIPSVVPGEVGPSWLKTVDTQVSWDKKIGERFTITPSVGFFNVFNFRNWDAAGNTLSGALSGQAGSINGTFGNGINGNGNRTNAIGTGTGVFSLGAGRAIEWGLRFQF